jgi:hypothetical protein
MLLRFQKFHTFVLRRGVGDEPLPFDGGGVEKESKTEETASSLEEDVGLRESVRVLSTGGNYAVYVREKGREKTSLGFVCTKPKKYGTENTQI